MAAVALPGLARRWDGAEPLPAGVVDAAAAVMSFGDQIGYLPPVDDHAQALLAPGSGTDGDSTGGKPVTYGGLLAWAAATGHVAGARTLVTTADPGSAAQAAPAPLATALRECLGAWAADASVVLCGREHSARLREDPALRARLVTQEQVG